MKYFVTNLLLAIMWAALHEFRLIDLLGGFLLGFVIIAIWRNWLGVNPTSYIRRSGGRPNAVEAGRSVFYYARQTLRLLGFTMYYAGELVKSTFVVLLAVFRDQSTLRPGIIAYPLDARTDLEIVLLNNLLSMTPGTLGVDLSDDRRVLYIHLIDVPNADAARESIRKGLERRLLRVLR